MEHCNNFFVKNCTETYAEMLVVLVLENVYGLLAINNNVILETQEVLFLVQQKLYLLNN